MIRAKRGAVDTGPERLRSACGMLLWSLVPGFLLYNGRGSRFYIRYSAAGGLTRRACAARSNQPGGPTRILRFPDSCSQVGAS